MAQCYIEEFERIGKDASGARVNAARQPAATTQNVTFTTATQSAAFGNKTKLIRMYCTAAAHYSFGSDPTADTDAPQIAADAPEYFEVQAGDKVSVVAA